MKDWVHIFLAAISGVIASAVIFFVTSMPRGVPIELLPAPTPAPILIYVVGAVQNPGVYPLDRDSRVSVAIEAAGGFTEEVNQDAVNLAARLKDGEKIVIPKIGEPTPTPSPSENTDRSGNIPVGQINLNTATMEELQTLPGIGEIKAKDIIQYREANGGFKTIEDIQNVSGIGPATFERLKELIIVD